MATKRERKTPVRKPRQTAKKTTRKPRDERRHYQRADLDLLVQHRFATLEEFIEKMAINISAGGMFLATDQPREHGTTIYLRFALADGLPLIEGIGRVVHVNRPGEPDRTAGMGIEFVSLDEDSRRLIDSLVLDSIEETAPAAAPN
ncbi:MAG: TIGR02266 family protein [Deltaproteobacteria bacterium]|nr:TIGR02266 family protein [Deltaproteobacteria bacterium]